MTWDAEVRGAGTADESDGLLDHHGKRPHPQLLLRVVQPPAAEPHPPRVAPQLIHPSRKRCRRNVVPCTRGIRTGRRGRSGGAPGWRSAGGAWRWSARSCRSLPFCRCAGVGAGGVPQLDAAGPPGGRGRPVGVGAQLPREGDQPAPQRGRTGPGRGPRQLQVGLLPRLLERDQVLGEAERWSHTPSETRVRFSLRVPRPWSSAALVPERFTWPLSALIGSDRASVMATPSAGAGIDGPGDHSRLELRSLSRSAGPFRQGMTLSWRRNRLKAFSSLAWIS